MYAVVLVSGVDGRTDRRGSGGVVWMRCGGAWGGAYACGGGEKAGRGGKRNGMVEMERKGKEGKASKMKWDCSVGISARSDDRQAETQTPTRPSHPGMPTEQGRAAGRSKSRSTGRAGHDTLAHRQVTRRFTASHSHHISGTSTVPVPSAPSKLTQSSPVSAFTPRPAPRPAPACGPG